MNTAAVNSGIHGGVRVDRRLRQHNNQQPLNCPRCDSINTKFCYYNNYNLSQPRHFCKNCRRYWTHGGVLRNVPVGGGCRKSHRRKRRRTPTQHPPSSSESSTTATAAVTTTTTSVNDGVVLPLRFPENEYNPRLFTGGFVSLMNNNTDDHTTSFGEIFEPIATAATKIDELMENRGGYGGLASTVDNWKDNSMAAASVDQGLFGFGSGVYDDRVYWNQSMNVVEDHTNWGRNCYDFPLFLP